MVAGSKSCSGSQLQSETANSDPRSFHSKLASGPHNRLEELEGGTSDYDFVCSHLGPLHDLLDVAPAECSVGTAQTLPRKAGKPRKSLRRYLRSLRIPGLGPFHTAKCASTV